MGIDYWQLAKDFSDGDPVQKYLPGHPGGLSPFIGRVTAVHRGLGMIDVQWPTGNERVSADELVRVNPELARWLPPTLDQSYSAYDIQQARKLWASSRQNLWRTTELPAGFHRELARLWLKGANEVCAYDDLWGRYASQTPDDILRDETAKFYRLACNLVELRIQQHAQKTAAYWVAQNRTYRATRDELGAKKPACPKCGTKMRKTTYKMDQGARARLFACPKDLFLIKVTDILGPEGEPVEW